MKKSRFTEEQIIGILKEADQGKKLEDIFRAHKISNATFYKWRRKFRGMEVPDAKKLRELEAENAKMKRLIANLSLDNMVLKDALGKK
jgi:putative transposase